MEGQHKLEQNSKKDLVVTLSVLLAVVFIVTGVLLTNKKKSNATNNAVLASNTATTTTSTTTPAAAPTDTTTDTASTNTSGFKDGSYTATGDYATPENTESIKVTVTLKDGVVTDTSATASMTSHDSKEYSTQFLQNYKSLVVGKSIASIKLSRVSGSSLTSQGFNDAIAQIETQAKS